jgi:myo-inositol 2-dehydrogenase/D-chiro-inositol 1-dehydrogenase
MTADIILGGTNMSQSPTVDQTHPKSRREFLKTSTAAAAAAATTSLAVGRVAHAAGSDALKIGLIGCGGRGSGAVVSALTVDPGARLTAVADAFEDRAQSARDRLKKKLGDRVAVDDAHCFPGFDGHRRLLESGVDVAILAEPPHFRPMHIEACVEAGVHLFAEKPMAVDAPGVRRVLAAGEKARNKNFSFISGFETRYSPAAREAVRRVHDGAIGDVIAIQGTYNVGFLWHRGHQPDWTEMQFQMRNWYYFTWLSGDHIVEQHVHFMDKVGWLMHDEPPLHAWGYGGRSVRTDPKWGDIFDHHAVVFEYPNGTLVYAFTRQQDGCWNEVSDLVLGTEGRLARGRGGRGEYVMEGKTNWVSEKSSVHPEINCFEEMFAAMRAGKPINDSLSMARSTMLAILGRMATHSGQRVTWEEAFNSKRVLAPESYAWDADPPVLPGPDGQYPHPIPGTTKVL